MQGRPTFPSICHTILHSDLNTNFLPLSSYIRLFENFYLDLHLGSSLPTSAAMAEVVSSIVTLTTVSLAIIQKTLTFIQEARKVPDLVKKLSVTLQDLESLIEDVRSTCSQVKPTEDDQSRHVEEALSRCSKRLEEVQELVKNLASRRSGTIVERVSLKIRSDRSKKDIQEAIHDIRTLMDQITQRASFWSLHVPLKHSALCVLSLI